MTGPEQRKLRILHYIPTLERAGAEGQLVENIRHMDRDKYENFICEGHASEDHKGALQEMGIPVLHVGTGTKLQMLRPARRIREIIWERQIDVFHIALFPTRAGFLAAMGSSVRVVTTLPNTFSVRERLSSGDATLRTVPYLEGSALA